MKYRVFLLLIIISFGAKGQIPENIASDRPGNAFSALSVGKGVFQSQTGLDYGGTGASGNRSGDFAFANAFLRYGVSNPLEVHANITYRSDWFSGNSISGLNNLGFGFRYNIFANEENYPDVGLVYTIDLNQILDEYETQNEQHSFLLLIQNPLNDKFSITGNLGFALVDPNRAVLGLYVLNLGYSINNKLSTYIESYGQLGDSGLVANFDTGLGYLINPDMQVDIYFGGGEFQNNHNYFVSLGLSARFGESLN